MGLGIRDESIYTIISIPLEWETIEILSNHFMFLANEIKKYTEIVSIRLDTPINQAYGKPCLEVVTFKKCEEDVDGAEKDK